MEEIDLKELIAKIWEKKVTIILLTVILMVLGFIYSSFLVVPKYSSYTKLVLGQSSSAGEGGKITTNDITLNSKLISTYTEVIKSAKVIRSVISNLGIEDKEESIRKNVSVTAESGTDIIKITVLNTDPQKAADIANEMAVVFSEEAKRLFGMDNINTLDLAEASKAPANINHVKTIVIFGIIGLVIAIGYVFIIFMLDNSVKSSDDIEKNMHIPVLASIPVYEVDTKVKSMGTKSKKRSKGGKRK